MHQKMMGAPGIMVWPMMRGLRLLLEETRDMIVAGSAVFQSEAKGFGDAKTAMDSMRTVVDAMRTGGSTATATKE